METFNRLAGVTEATNGAHDLPSNPVPEPPPIPPDVETSSQYDANSNRTSRASLPLNRRASHKSFRSTKSGKSNKSLKGAKSSPAHPPADYPPSPLPHRQQHPGRPSQDSGPGEEEDDFVWGPTHPCFPHPNPHCAPDSEEFQATRVIRVKRDWLQAGDLYPQYANLYPEILDPLMSDEEFRNTISNINKRLQRIFDPYGTRAWVDAIMGVVTGYVWDDLGLTGAKRAMKELEAFVDEWNERAAAEGREVKLVQLRRTGFMALDFVIPDPGIDVVGTEEQDDSGIGPAE